MTRFWLTVSGLQRAALPQLAALHRRLVNLLRVIIYLNMPRNADLDKLLRGREVWEIV